MVKEMEPAWKGAGSGRSGVRKPEMEKQKDNGIAEKVVEEIRQLAEDYHISKVILFGSRARGDFHRTSDIDLAVAGGDTVGFTLAVEEETSTLLGFDVVNLDGPVQMKLLEAIRGEGRTLYEKI